MTSHTWVLSFKPHSNSNSVSLDSTTYRPHGQWNTTVKTISRRGPTTRRNEEQRGATTSNEEQRGATRKPRHTSHLITPLGDLAKPQSTSKRSHIPSPTQQHLSATRSPLVEPHLSDTHLFTLPTRYLRHYVSLAARILESMIIHGRSISRGPMMEKNTDEGHEHGGSGRSTGTNGRRTPTNPERSPRPTPSSRPTRQLHPRRSRPSLTHSLIALSPKSTRGQSLNGRLTPSG